MAKNDSEGGCGCLILIILIAFFANKCDRSESETGDGDSLKISQTGIVSNRNYGSSVGYVESAYNLVEEKVDPEVERYKDNRLGSGSHPYTNERNVKGSGSRIVVSTSSAGNDVVVILKSKGYMVRNTYVRAGGSATFDIPDGTYQVFFYSGEGWNPNKEMPNGWKGGFVIGESFSKDYPQDLSNNILTYELIPQRNGNFQTKASNKSEVFN